MFHIILPIKCLDLKALIGCYRVMFFVLTTELTGMATPMREAMRVAMSACKNKTKQQDNIIVYFLLFLQLLCSFYILNVYNSQQ